VSAVMASVNNGNLSSSATWSKCDSTSFGNYSFANAYATALTTSYVSSATFTPGAITIDGIGIFINSLSGTSTGTVTVSLVTGGTTVSGTAVSVNTSALPGNGWVFFKFTTSVTLIAATVYSVQIEKSATGDTINVGRTTSTAGDWCRALRTTTTGSPASTDSVIICGERTGLSSYNAINVYMDSISTSLYCADFNISDKGTLGFLAVASTNYYLKIGGNFTIWMGVSFTLGTSGTPLASNVTMTFEMAASTLFQAWDNSTVTIYGAAKTSWTYLTSNAAASQAVLNCTSVTGWANGDSLIITPTDGNHSHVEFMTISSITGNAVTLTSNLTYAHSATVAAPAEVGNQTRNIIFKPTSSACCFYMHNNCTCDINNIEFLPGWGGAAGNAGNRGIELGNSNVSNSQYFRNCCVTFGGTANYSGLVITGTNPQNIIVDHNLFYDCSTGSTINIIPTATSPVVTYTNNLHLTYFGGSYQLIFNVGPSGITFTNNNFSNFNFFGPQFVFGTSPYASTISGITIHDGIPSGDTALTLEVNSIVNNPVISNITIARCAGYGVGLNCTSAPIFTINNLVVSGNLTANDGAICFQSTNTLYYQVIVNGGTISGNVVVFGYTSSSPSNGYLRFNGVTFSTNTSDVYLQGATTNFTMIFDNCTRDESVVFVSGSRTLISSNSVIIVNGANDYQWYGQYGSILRDNIIYHTASPSMKMIPLSASSILLSNLFYFPVTGGVSTTISSWMRGSVVGDAGGAAFNGTASMVIPANFSLGMMTTLSVNNAGTNGTWTQVSLTFTPTYTGVVGVYFTCEGTTGWENIDDITSNAARINTTKFDYWYNGQPMIAYG
jgi:hypothetical protein